MAGKKMVFVSNYFNHHQLYVCDALYRLLKGDFSFIQMEEMEEERIRMGWSAEERNYVLSYAADPTGCQELIDTADVVIFGGEDDERTIQDRLRAGKPILRYAERPYKEAQWKAISPRGLLRKFQDHTRYRKAPVYLLCAGAYVADDYHIFHAYPKKMLRYGYFPEVKHYADREALFASKEPHSILWAARMIDWKHPELAIAVAKHLKDKGLPFHLNLIGGGPMEEELRASVEAAGLTEEVSFLGFRTPSEVRSYMERSEIYLMTSDRKEGWGAVVNEAMNSGCAVVADHMAGAVPTLLRDGVNGCIYRDGDAQGLCETVERLLAEDCERETGVLSEGTETLCEAELSQKQIAEKLQEQTGSLSRRLGEQALTDIETLWNPEAAAERIVEFCQKVGFLADPLDAEKTHPDTTVAAAKDSAAGYVAADRAVTVAGRGEAGETSHSYYAGPAPALWQDGPLSPAPVIHEKKMYRYLKEQANL